ncbi:complement factor H-like [Fundulus heteroclitus]|uniref:complement factor H-like n=1 Tax=Fundulus heteroclitus TaxID=8078 RepID=UPI00165B8BF2|nr:complement factor H-like [Fundulus heteroclitus]
MQGSASIECLGNGQWSDPPPQCGAPIVCSAPPPLEDGDTKSYISSDSVFQHGDKVEYICQQMYTMSGEPFKTCDNGVWIGNMRCLTNNCEIGGLHPRLYIAGIPSTGEAIVAGHKLRFFCAADHKLDGPEEIECSGTGQWSASFPTCSEKCKRPEVPEDVHITSSVQGNGLSKGDILSFACNRRTDFMQGSASIECLGNGQWSDLPPQCKAPIVCSAPPPLKYGDTKSYISSDSVFQHGDKVEYICRQMYTMSGEPFKTCDNGVWIGDMRCLKPCTLNQELFLTHDILFIRGNRKELLVPHKDHLLFICMPGTTHDGRVPMRVQCNDGEVTLPTCRVTDM